MAIRGNRSVGGRSEDRLEQIDLPAAGGFDGALVALRRFGLEAESPAQTEEEPVDTGHVEAGALAQCFDRIPGCDPDAGLSIRANPGPVHQMPLCLAVCDRHASGPHHGSHDVIVDDGGDRRWAS